jgi:hypothetical protein
MTKLFRGSIFRRVVVIMSGLLLATVALGIYSISGPRAFSQAADTSDAAVLEGYRHTEVASVSDALEKITGQKMYLSHRMRPIFTSKFAGFALTVKLKKEENKDPGAPHWDADSH